MRKRPISPDRDAAPSRPRGSTARRLRVAVLAGVGLWAALLATWVAFGRPRPWRDWLAKVKLIGSDSDHEDRRIGRPADAGDDLAYDGQGKARLGHYHIRLFNPVTGSSLHTDFRVEGRTTCGDQEQFRKFMRSNYRLFREQVMVTLRNCHAGELASPDLRLLEKKLVSRVNRALDRDFLHSAQIKDFAVYEAVREPRR